MITHRLSTPECDYKTEEDNVIVDYDKQGRICCIHRLGPGKLIPLSPNRQVLCMETKSRQRRYHPDGSSVIMEFDYLTNTATRTEVKSPNLSLFDEEDSWRKLHIVG